MMIKPIHAVIIIALIAVVAFLYLGGDLDLGNLTNDTSDTPSGTDRCNYGDRDIHAALCVLTGKSLPWVQTQPFIDSLHMKMCSADGTDFYTVAQYYRNEWLTEGYSIYNEGTTYATGYTTFSGIYYLSTNGKAMITGSGASITSYYGHDVMFITSDGPLTTYVAFVTFINSV